MAKRILKRDLMTEYFKLMQGEGNDSDRMLFLAVECKYVTSGHLLIYTSYNAYGARQISEATDRALFGKSKKGMASGLDVWHWGCYLNDIEATIQKAKQIVREKFVPFVSGI